MSDQSVREANLTSHLTISYSASPTASSTPAAATATDTPAADSPLGFLAALVDHLMGGSPTPALDTGDAVAAAAPDEPATANTPSLFNLGLQVQGQDAIHTPPQGVTLLKQLTDELTLLQNQLDAGQKPDQDLLKKLGQTADALAALINVPVPQATAPVADPKAALDPLAAIGAADPATPSADDAPAANDNPPSVPAEQMAQLLATLGLAPPAQQPAAPSSSNATDAVLATGGTTPPAPPAALVELVQTLSKLTDALEAPSPDTAQKLAALATKLTAAEASPALAAQVSSNFTTDQDDTALDKIIATLTAPKPADALAATPQLATATKLPVPEPLVLSRPKDVAAEPAQPASPDAKLTLTPVPQSTSSAPAIKIDDTPAPKAKSDTQAVAAFVAAATDRSDASSAANSGAAAVAPAGTAPAAARAIPAAYQAVANPINLGQMAFEMVRQVHQGQSRFTIRLDPPELGRVDVKMHVDGAGNVNARLTVERSETLDMFQRDRGSLEKALSQAGLDSGKTNLEFSLKQNPFAGMTGSDQRGSNTGYGGGRFASGADADDAASGPSITLYRGTASAGGVNLFV